jgi:hypothetical protein
MFGQKENTNVVLQINGKVLEPYAVFDLEWLIFGASSVLF